MKSTTFALSALASLGLVIADGWYNNTEIVHPSSEITYYPDNSSTDTVPPITTYTTQTGYTTYCPETTVVTVMSCDDHTCVPHSYPVAEPGTLTIPGIFVVPVGHKPGQAHDITADLDVTVTNYATYLPKPTVVTITTCTDDNCAPHAYSISEATTLTVSKAVVPNTIGSAGPKSTLAAVSTHEAGAAKIAASFAGLVGVVLLV